MSSVRLDSYGALSRKMAKGAVWSVLLRIFDRTIGILSISILARLLTPGDFGVVALAVSAITIVEALGALNVEAALIRIRDAGKADFDTAWTQKLQILNSP